MVPKQFCSSNGGLVWSPALTHETGRGWILPPPAVLEISSMLVAECDTRPPEGSAHGMVTLCLVFEYFGCQNRVQLLLGQWVGSRAVAVAICVSTKLVYLNFSQPASSFSDFFHCFFHYFLIVPAFFFYCINYFAMVFLAAVTAGSALVQLPPLFYVPSKPQSSGQGWTPIMLIFICLWVLSCIGEW